MLHIKDIEAFAHINEALARDTGATRRGAEPDGHHPPLHPALLVAMAATGRLTPEEEEDRKHHPASLSGMMARLMRARGR